MRAERGEFQGRGVDFAFLRVMNREPLPKEHERVCVGGRGCTDDAAAPKGSPPTLPRGTSSLSGRQRPIPEHVFEAPVALGQVILLQELPEGEKKEERWGWGGGVHVKWVFMLLALLFQPSSKLTRVTRETGASSIRIALPSVGAGGKRVRGPIRGRLIPPRTSQGA